MHALFLICSLLFFNPLKFVVTGSRDGSIKVWDEEFGIKLVFVGHHGPVTSLNLYPQVRHDIVFLATKKDIYICAFPWLFFFIGLEKCT